MDQSGHDTAFPQEMQGHWVEASDPSYEIVIGDGEIHLCGEPIDYRTKVLRLDESGALMVEFSFADEVEPHEQEITQLFYWPEGHMHALNDHGVAELVRAGS